MRKFPMTEPTEASRQMIDNFQVCSCFPNAFITTEYRIQFSSEMEASLASSLEAGDGNQFRLDLPKVSLSLWMELRSRIPEEELPTYKKGEYLNGADHHIFLRVMQHMVSCIHFQNE